MFWGEVRLWKAAEVSGKRTWGLGGRRYLWEGSSPLLSVSLVRFSCHSYLWLSFLGGSQALRAADWQGFAPSRGATTVLISTALRALPILGQ